MFSFLLAVQILVSVSIISLVLLQQGKGADMGAAFGSGASGTVFGARGSGSFFTRATAILAAVFFINCLLIASPLVRESTQPEETLADRIEQQAEGVPAVEADLPAAGAEDVPAAAMQEQVTAEQGDVPAAPAGEPVAPAADDLPQ